MRKISTVLCYVVIASSSVMLSCASRKSEAVKQKEFVTSDHPGVKNGEQVYMKYCQKCHPGGEAGLGPGINSNPAPQFVKRFQMRHGLGVMPSFKSEEISSKDLKDISRYLKAWKRY